MKKVSPVVYKKQTSTFGCHVLFSGIIWDNIPSDQKHRILVVSASNLSDLVSLLERVSLEIWKELSWDKYQYEQNICVY